MFDPDNTKPRILLVDDNANFTRWARGLLERTGHYIVDEEHDPRRAMETARGFRPDLVLLDLIMPELDGAELARQMETDWILRRVPIVFLTALITPEESRQGRVIDGHRAFAKPGSGSEFIQVVENALPLVEAA